MALTKGRIGLCYADTLILENKKMPVFDAEDQKTVSTIGWSAAGFAALTIALIVIALIVT